MDVAACPPAVSDAARRGRPPAAWLLAAGLLATSLLALGVAWWLEPSWFGMIDLRVYRAGGSAVLHGKPLYAAHPDGSQLPFTYPPFAALLFAPLAAVSFPVAQGIVAVAWLVCLLAVLAMSMDAIGYRPGRAALLAGAAAAIWLDPVRGTLGYGQVNLLLVALVLADFTGRFPRLPRGVLIGVAAGLKLTPGLFAVYLLITGRRRAAGMAFASFLGTAAVGRLILPADSARYWGRLWYDPGHVGGVAYAGNQSLYGLASRLLHGTHQGLPWLLGCLVVGAGGMAMAAAAYRGGRELTGVSLCALTGLMLCPISWNHHWVWVLPGTVIAVASAVRRPTPARLARLAAWVGVFVTGMIWWVPRGGYVEYHEHGVQLLMGNAYLLAGLGALGLAAVRIATVRAVRPESTTGRETGNTLAA